MVLNLPGTEECDLQRPWVSKKIIYGMLAADLFIYVGDGRPIDPTNTLCWQASRRWVLTCSWLSIQDVSRKVQPPSQVPGPCDGNFTNIELGVCVCVCVFIFVYMFT